MFCIKLFKKHRYDCIHLLSIGNKYKIKYYCLDCNKSFTKVVKRKFLQKYNISETTINKISKFSFMQYKIYEK